MQTSELTDTVGVTIPAYDQDISTLESFITEIQAVLSPDTIRVELDDPTGSHVDRLSGANIDLNVSHDRRGKGAAIMSGFDALETDIVAFADADGSVPAGSLKDIVRQIEQGVADVSIGSRRHPSSNIVTHQTVARRFLGDIFASMAKYTLPTHCRDYQCGAKALRSEAWSMIGHHCYEPGFAWDLEFVSVAGSLGYDIAEVPVTWNDHPNSTVDPVSTAGELATALFDVRRRTDAIASSPRYHDIQVTDRSTLMQLSPDDNQQQD